MNNDEKIIDVSFTETDIKEERPFYYTTSQVAIMLGETDSAVRVWCNQFKDILKIETSGRNRTFRQEDIDQLKIIKSLIRDKGFSHKQVIEHLSKKEDEILNEVAVADKDPLAVQSIAVALAKEINSNMTNVMKDMYVHFEEREDRIKKENQEQIQSLKDTINDLSEKLDNQFKALDDKELEAKNRDLEISDLLHKSLEERKQENNSEKKGFFERWFSK